MHTNARLTLVTLLFIATQASAECVPSLTVGAACKVWPAKPTLTIRTATTFVADKTDPSGDSGDYDLALQLEDTNSQAPVASYKQPALYNSDAVAFEGLTIDTARYVLNPSTRAFGLRAKYEHSSSYSPYSAEQLTLYIQEGHNLRPVLDGLITRSQQGEWDTEQCTGEGLQRRRTVEMASTTTHGFADLVVRTEIVKLKSLRRGGECVDDNSAPRVDTITLKYNGSTYPIPDEMHSF